MTREAQSSANLRASSAVSAAGIRSLRRGIARCIAGIACIVAAGVLTPSAVHAQAGRTQSDSAPPIQREFRAAWVATVSNIDWPSKPGLPVPEQKRELIAILDRAVQLNLNAIIFQVRPAADALYKSTLEPWSYFLTGRQGRAPDPLWDPLEFAVDEAHARGLELHAWFNPYRSHHPADTSRPSPRHISRTTPAAVTSYGGFGWMDPGRADVRKHTIDVVLDVVRRYDIDGVHLDDYFYPYPVLDRRRREVPFDDDASWRRYRAGGGTLSRGAWRRRNVDILVEELYAAVHLEKPWVRFGISPFGIWRPGYPASVAGFDPFEKLYADSRRWLREGWVDYFTPQLYWKTDAPRQRYSELLRWWVDQNVKHRHIWVGNYTSRVGMRGSAGWPATEILKQIEATRAQPGATGNVHFSMDGLMDGADRLVERLEAGPYREPALVPATPWLPGADLPAPLLAVVTDSMSGQTTIVLTPGSAESPWLWTVRVRRGDSWTTRIIPGDLRRFTLEGAPPRTIVVTGVNRVGVESPVTRAELPL
jgi:uncharacterized lipoprotein YddW (UPF0748 family)